MATYHGNFLCLDLSQSSYLEYAENERMDYCPLIFQD